MSDDKILSHGKLAGMTFRKAYEADPSYAVYASQAFDGDGPLRAYGDFCRAEIEKAGGSQPVLFGKHAGKSYDQLLAADPGYCQYITSIGRDVTNAEARHLVQWLTANMPA